MANKIKQADWMQFEIDCTDYLNKTYGKFFDHKGGANSYLSDIECKKPGHNFFIECKMPKAQSGQFVLKPDFATKSFAFSTKEPSAGIWAQAIQKYLSDEKVFDKVVNGKEDVNQFIPTLVLIQWVKKAMIQKRVKYVISARVNAKYTGDFKVLLIPVEQIQNYFDISASYRFKYNGSSELSASDRSASMLGIIQSNFGGSNLRWEVDGSLKSDSALRLSGNNSTSFGATNQSRGFSIREIAHNTYKVNKLSNSGSMTLAFSITQRPTILETMIDQNIAKFESIEGFTKSKKINKDEEKVPLLERDPKDPFGYLKKFASRSDKNAMSLKKEILNQA